MNETNNITLATHFYMLPIKGTDIVVNVKELMMAEIGSEDAWINITPILKAYNKSIRDWLRSEQIMKFINLMNDKFVAKNKLASNFNSGNLPNMNEAHNIGVSKTEKATSELASTSEAIRNESGHLVKPPFTKSQWFKKDKYEWLNNDCPLIVTKGGRYNSGTYLHQKLFLKFITTLDVEIEVMLYEAIMNVFKSADVVKKERHDTKADFKKMTALIKSDYIPKNKNHYNPYYMFADLINLHVLGGTAQNFKAINHLEKNDVVRNHLIEEDLHTLIEAERTIVNLIAIKGVTSFCKISKELKKDMKRYRKRYTSDGAKKRFKKLRKLYKATK